jgi:hypothetical protein
MKLKYSILSYHPSFMTEKSINIGVLIHCVDNGMIKFEKIKQWKRLENFDNELNINFVKIFLEGIEETISNSGDFNIDNFIKIYVNEFKFSKVNCIELESEEQIENIYKNILK